MTALHDFMAGDRIRTRSKLFTGIVREAMPNVGTLVIDWDDEKNNARPSLTWHLDIERICP